jgi:hypothetical protein
MIQDLLHLALAFAVGTPSIAGATATAQPFDSAARHTNSFQASQRPAHASCDPRLAALVEVHTGRPAPDCETEYAAPAGKS